MTRVIDYFKLTSPRINLLVLLTGFTGMWMGSAGAPRPSPALWGLAGIGLASACASVFNNYFDRDIDGMMVRTCKRPLPAGRVSPSGTLLFGISLFVIAFSVLILFVNALSALLAALTVFLYSFLYTVVLKRKTPLATEIGGISGALPPVIGWTAARGEIGVGALMLFAVMLLWQPPHFWSLASMNKTDYKRAGIPTFPVIRSAKETKWRSSAYVAAMMLTSFMPYYFGASGRLYLLAALILGSTYLSLYLTSLFSERISDRCLFRCSIIYLAFIFFSMAADVNIR